jgi:hypothetical protein
MDSERKQDRRVRFHEKLNDGECVIRLGGTNQCRHTALTDTAEEREEGETERWMTTTQ